jgi:tetratricopeptide (TPR) repeat protein
MIRSRKITALSAAFLVSCISGSMLLLRQVDRVRRGATLEEVLYISSPKTLKRFSLGYDGLMADIYWTRAVQYFGGKQHIQYRGRYELLWPLLNITTQLDPHLIPAYAFGQTFLSAKPPEGAGTPEKAIELVEYGIRNNPDDWHLYYDLGFIHYDLKDYRGAADAFLRGSKVPNAHPFLKVLAAAMAEHGGDLQMARMLWSATYQTTHDKQIKANAAAHLQAVQSDSDVIELERQVAAYRQRTGHLPDSFAEMAKAGYLRGIPLDPLGNPYKLTPDGHVLLAHPDDLPFVQKGLPPGYIPPSVVKLPSVN